MIEKRDQSPYGGRWVAKLRGQVVGQGGTPRQALHAAQAARFKEAPQVEYMAGSNHRELPPLIEKLRTLLPASREVYLVGGAVRDLLLGRNLHDFDLTVAGKAIPLARQIANSLKADFYIMDEERDVARVLMPEVEDRRDILDFITLQGADIDADLAARDVTINAMAVDLRQPDGLLDPLGGAADLAAKRLRACGPDSFAADPIRVIRAIRMAAQFGLKIEAETKQRMKNAAPALAGVSPERLRDELLKLFLAPKPATSVRAMERLGVLDAVFPELKKLKGIEQSPPHAFDVWEHTLQVIDKLDFVLQQLDENYPTEEAKELLAGLIALKLGRYRAQVSELMNREFVLERPRRALLFFAALLHDAAKPESRSVEESGRIRFIGHETRSAELARVYAQKLRLSAFETDYLHTVVQGHGRPFAMTRDGITRRAIYRFFRDTGEAGVDICLLSLADFLGKYGAGIPDAELNQQLDTLRTLLEAYYEKPQESVAPPAFFNGDGLMKELGIEPGPKVGEILEAIKEAQATGEVSSPDEALKLARSLLNSQR